MSSSVFLSKYEFSELIIMKVIANNSNMNTGIRNSLLTKMLVAVNLSK